MGNLPIANKNFGQHFLRDQNVIQKITQDYTGASDIIIEVGPGPGILTQHLSPQGKPLYLIEKDQRFLDELARLTPRDNIFMQDALEFDWENFLKDKKGQSLWLVSNLPYNVSAPLFIQFLTIPQIQYMTLMFQKEVANKIAPPPQEKNTTSSLSILGQIYFEIKPLCKALPGAFVPPPKVDSLVLSFKRKENSLIPIHEFPFLEKFLRMLFAHKRKQINGTLKSMKVDGSRLSFSGTLRAESLSFSQVLELYHLYKEQYESNSSS